MTCEQVRERLPEHLLGTLNGADDVNVRAHLRACAACRAEMRSLGDGLTTFARASHDRRPPADLRDRVLTVLEEEWRDAPVVLPEAGARRGGTWLAAAAALVVLVASLGWGVSQSRRADEAAAGYESYRHILDVLGGKDFRIGTLQASGPQQVSGSVVLYDAHTDQSWGLVLVHAPGLTGTAHAVLSSASGRTIKLLDLKFGAEGDASSWLVSTSSITSFGRLTITAPDGTTLATADIGSA